MKRILILATGFVAALGAPDAIAAHTTPAYVTAAINDTARPDEDKKLDEERLPSDMLAFAGIKPGMKVMDLIPGRGYFTRLFAKAVGDKGYVYSYQPTEFDAFNKGKPAPIKAVATEYKNVSAIDAPINSLAAPELLDVVWTSQNYHDLHDSFAKPADLAIINKAVFAALKPGGLYIILDHAAAAGSGLRDTETLHRIDEATVKQEVLAAGFKLVGESNILRNPKDPHDKIVFDPSIRRQTDKFILKFMKPRH
ncbi:MAG: class I SAM-dependent methyltransferase [Rhizomicrobium sp.]